MVAPSTVMANNSNFIALDIQLQHLLLFAHREILLVSLMRYDISPVLRLVRVVPFDRAPPHDNFVHI